MTFQEWWIDPNARMPFPATGADLQEWCRQAFMAGADAANTMPHRIMFDEGICVGKVMAAKECAEIADLSYAYPFDVGDAIKKKFGLEI